MRKPYTRQRRQVDPSRLQSSGCGSWVGEVRQEIRFAPKSSMRPPLAFSNLPRSPLMVGDIQALGAVSMGSVANRVRWTVFSFPITDGVHANSPMDELRENGVRLALMKTSGWR